MSYSNEKGEKHGINNGVVVIGFKQENGKEQKQKEAEQNGNTETVLQVTEERSDRHDKKIDSYVIDEVNKNTVDNPYKESTITLPHLIRRVDSRELTPKPFTSFNQILIISYISILFFPFFGAIANMYAWKAKLKRGKGLYALAKRQAKLAVYWSLGSFASGLAVLIIVLATNYKEL